jgi:hypothetical protein
MLGILREIHTMQHLRTHVRIGKLLPLAGLVLALAAQQRCAAAPSQPSESLPRGWLAFVAERGSLDPGEQLAGETPRVILFRAGLILWRRERQDGPRRNDAEWWREAWVGPAAMGALAAVVEKNGFFVRDPREVASEGGGLDSPTTSVGVSLNGRTRIITHVHPDRKSWLGQVYEAILAARPMESRRYEPRAIRVGFYHPGFCASDTAPPVIWPLTETSVPRINERRYYAGAEARAVIAAIAGRCRALVGEQEMNVFWAPALGTPEPQAVPPDRRAAEQAQALGPFADVRVGHWAYDAVNELAALGLFNGYPDNTFSGNRVTTRYELAVAFQRLEQEMNRGPLLALLPRTESARATESRSALRATGLASRLPAEWNAPHFHRTPHRRFVTSLMEICRLEPRRPGAVPASAGMRSRP